MDKSADYQKAIAEAKESIQMPVEEYKQTTMSPTLIGRFYDEEKHRSEVEQAEERNLEEIKRDTESGKVPCYTGKMEAGSRVDK